MTTATSFTELAADVQRQALSSLEQAQDLSLRATELTVGLVPDELFDPNRAVSTAKQAVAGGFDFTAQVVARQKAYALRLLDVFAEPAKPAE